MAHHSSDEELRALLAGPGRRDPQLRHRVVRRLLEDGSGRERRDTREPGGGRWRKLAEPAVGAIDYDEVLARAEQTFSFFFSEGRPVEEPPGILLSELVPGAAQVESGWLPSRDLRRAIPMLTKWLIHRSHAARYEDPKKMLHWGLMARLASDSCPVQAAGGRERLADLRARAWGQFGNALRVCGRFREAAEVLAAAREHLERGTGDLSLRARLYEQVAALYIQQKSFGNARDLLKEAEAICEEIGETHGLASSLLQSAITLQYAGEPDLAVRVIDRAVALLDPIESPDLLLVAGYNRALAYVSIDRSDRILSSFRALRRSCRGKDRAVLMLRTFWQEGNILSEIGHLDAAETAFRSARRGFIERDLAPEVVASTRDLIGLYRKMGKRREIEDTLVETQALFFGVTTEVEVLNGLCELETLAAL